MSWGLVPPPDLDPVEVEETERVACPECGCVSERVVGEPFGCSETGVSCLTLDAAGVPDEARELATTWMPPVLFGGAL
jgi:hypothetical protein